MWLCSWKPNNSDQLWLQQIAVQSEENQLCTQNTRAYTFAYTFLYDSYVLRSAWYNISFTWDWNVSWTSWPCGSHLNARCQTNSLLNKSHGLLFPTSNFGYQSEMSFLFRTFFFQSSSMLFAVIIEGFICLIFTHRKRLGGLFCYVLFRLKCELQFMYNIVSCTFDWYLLLSIKSNTLELQRLLPTVLVSFWVALSIKTSWCYGKVDKTTLNFIRRVSKSMVKCCSVEFPWSAVYYKLFCLSKQFFSSLVFSVIQSIFSEKNTRNKKINWCGLNIAWTNAMLIV